MRALTSTRQVVPGDQSAWLELWRAAATPTVYQHPSWSQVLADSFGVESLPLAACRGGAVVGILPLYYARNVFSGRILAGLEGDVLGDDPETHLALHEAAIDLARSRGADHLLLRGAAVPVTAQATPGPLLLRSMVRLASDPQSVFGGLSKRTRQRVRRAGREGYTVERDSRDLRGFYDIFAARQHAHGTPNFGWPVMRELAARFGNALSLYAAHHNGRLLGGIVAIRGPHVWTGVYGAVARVSDDSDFATYALYWALIEDACAAGASFVDLGSNLPDSGSAEFKSRWSNCGEWLRFQYVGAGSRVRDLRSGAGRLQRLWRRLPAALATRLGPYVRRSLPFG